MDKVSNHINIPTRRLPISDTAIKPQNLAPVEQSESFSPADSSFKAEPSKLVPQASVPELRQKPAEETAAQTSSPPPARTYDDGPLWTEDFGLFPDKYPYNSAGAVWEKQQQGDGIEINRVFLPKSVGNDVADSLRAQGIEVLQFDSTSLNTSRGAIRCISQFLEREPSEG